MKELNLIPYELTEKRVKKQKIKDIIAYGIILSCVLFICIYIPQMFLEKLKAEEISLKEQIAINSKIITENESLKSEIANINSYIAKVDAASKGKTIAADKIHNLTKYVPKGVSLINLSYSGSSITVNGVSNSYQAVSELTANLQMSGDYKNSRLISLSTSGDKASRNDGSYIFTLEITY